MQKDSFFQSLFMCIFSGFIAACLIWLVRSIDEQYVESGSGWQSMYKRRSLEQGERR